MLINEIACKNRETAFAIADLLLLEDHVVMLSKEEDLTIINFHYSQHADRNGIAFGYKEDY